MIHIFLLAFLLSSAEALTETDARKFCFVAVSSLVPRTVITTTNAGSLAGCHVPCALNTHASLTDFPLNVYCSQCEACSYNATTSKCTLLGPLAPSTGCSKAYTAYEKRSSGCTAISSIPSDDSYTPYKCSRISDVLGLPAGNRLSPVCGMSTTGNRRIVYDVALHDGTRWVLENFKRSFIDWDEVLGSYYYNSGSQIYYFRTGTCVRAPSPPLSGCDCPSLFSEAPLAGYVATGVAVRTETAPACAGLVQLHFARVEGTGGERVEVMNSTDRAVYCAMGTWMNIIDSPSTYNEYSVSAATCVAAG